jgi:molecular chaperone DnaK
VVEELCTPLVERSLEVCRRLLGNHGLAPGRLIRLVLVGGPTVMPFLRRRVIDALEAPAAEGLDPMTLVAQGAALYAASARLDGRPQSTVVPQTGGRRVWLQYPAVSSDLTPHVIGRFVAGDGKGPEPVKVRLVRPAGPGVGPWISTDATVAPDGGWLTSVDLVPRKTSQFRIEAFAADGDTIETVPASFSIVQGVTISDPPLSRTIGVALASGAVQVYFERGAPLPARRTFTHHTVETIARGTRESVVRIPIVQGELEEAHLCRLVGTLEIDGATIRDTVPMSSLVELTLELDRGGRLSARALIPAIDQVFESVAHLLVPDADPAALDASLTTMRRQLAELRTEAFRGGTTGIMEKLDRVEARLAEAERDVDAAHGGDADAAQKARRTLLEIDATLSEAEIARKWPELEDSARSAVAFASDAVSSWGTDAERQLLDEVVAAVTRARTQKDPVELQRQLRLVRRIGNSAFNRNPEVWELYFEVAASHSHEATDMVEAQKLVRQGREAVTRGDRDTLRRVVKGLWRLEPASVQGKRLGYDSGVR